MQLIPDHDWFNDDLGAYWRYGSVKRFFFFKSPIKPVVKPGSQLVFCKMGHLSPFPLGPLEMNNDIL